LPDQPLDAAIIYAPAGQLVPLALRAVRKGGKVVCAGIYMIDIPGFPYHLLWGERQLVSVANLTRQDGLDFLKVAPQAGIRTETTAFPLSEANEVLERRIVVRRRAAAVGHRPLRWRMMWSGRPASGASPSAQANRPGFRPRPEPHRRG
jgi:D-arabinose 1-dehydrogenase-like Zn-dependent alcohol dehydrogenase